MNEPAKDGEQVVVLAIESDADGADVLRGAFDDTKLVNDLVIVDHGDKALDFLHQRDDYADSPRPDLILLNLEIPGPSGEEILAELENNRKLRRIPVIVVTSSDKEEDIARSYDLHANAYVQKPVNSAEFSDALQAIEAFWFRNVRLPPEDDDKDDQPIVG